MKYPLLSADEVIKLIKKDGKGKDLPSIFYVRRNEWRKVRLVLRLAGYTLSRVEKVDDEWLDVWHKGLDLYDD